MSVPFLEALALLKTADVHPAGEPNLTSPVLTPAEAAGKLQIGDIFLAHRRNQGKLPIGNWIIEKAQGTPYAHAAIYDGKKNVLHTYAGKGANRLSLEEFNNIYDYKVYRPQASLEQKKDAVNFAHKVVKDGRGYSFRDNILGWLPPHTKNVDEDTRRKDRDAATMNCGGLVASSYAGIPWAEGKRPTHVIPVEFAKSPFANHVGTVLAPDSKLRNSEALKKTAEEKTALIERLMRLGATDVPGTPRLFMRQRSPEELMNIQHGVEGFVNKYYADPLKNRIKGAVEKLPNWPEQGLGEWGKQKALQLPSALQEKAYFAAEKLPNMPARDVLRHAGNLVVDHPLEVAAGEASLIPGAVESLVAGKIGLHKIIDKYLTPKVVTASAQPSGQKAGGGTASGGGTAWQDFTIEHTLPMGNRTHYVIAFNRDNALHALMHEDEGMIASASFRPHSKNQAEITSMYVHPDFRGQGHGKSMWKTISFIHPDMTFHVKPDPFKDRDKSKEDLAKVYQSYGFQKHEDGEHLVLHPLSKEKTAEEKKFKLQGHIDHQGLGIAVENRKGSVRKGVDKDGKPWRTEMKMPYGYIKGTKGADGEEVDAYVGPKKDATHAFVVHQRKDNGKGYDEDKVMLGFASKEEAVKGYLKHYNDPKFLGPVSTVPMDRLKELVESGKTLKKISSARMDSFFDELQKLGAVGDEELERTKARYKQLQEQRPDAAQVGRYMGFGAVTAPALSAVGNAIRGGRMEGQSMASHLTGARAVPFGVARSIASDAARGALAAGAIPVLRGEMDRRVEMRELAHKLKEHEGTAGRLEAPFTPIPESSGGVSKLAKRKKEKDSASFENTPAQSWSGNGIVEASFEGEKAAFATSEYSSNIGRPSAPQVSQLPPFRVPALRGPQLQKESAGAPTRGGFLMASEIPPFRVQPLGTRSLEKKSGVASTPGGRLSASRAVGAQSAAPSGPGPNTAAQAGHVGTPMPGSIKGGIGKRVPKFTPTMSAVPPQQTM